MFRFFIFSLLVVSAIAYPSRVIRDTDDTASAGNVVADTADEKPDLEGRFGGGGYPMHGGGTNY